MGYDVGEGIFRVPDARVRALRDFARPRTKKDLRAFLGTASYNRRFIPDFAGRAGPLFNALKMVAPTSLVWDNIMTSSFTYLTSTLCSSNMLWLPREDDHFTLHMDASLQVLGVVLSVIRDVEERPIAYFSRRLLPAEENYSASELECLVVVKAIDHFTIHLLGKPFTVVTDHRALAALHTPNKLNRRLMRWALALQAYNFKVQNRPGSKYQNADGLSRQSWPDGGDTEKGEGTTTPGITLMRGRCWGSTQHDLSGQLEPQSL